VSRLVGVSPARAPAHARRPACTARPLGGACLAHPLSAQSHHAAHTHKRDNTTGANKTKRHTGPLTKTDSTPLPRQKVLYKRYVRVHPGTADAQGRLCWLSLPCHCTEDWVWPSRAVTLSGKLGSRALALPHIGECAEYCSQWACPDTPKTDTTRVHTRQGNRRHIPPASG